MEKVWLEGAGYEGAGQEGAGLEGAGFVVQNVKIHKISEWGAGERWTEILGIRPLGPGFSFI